MEEVAYRKESEHCFSLVMDEFCRNETLYLLIVSLTMYIFLLTGFDTWHCFYFELIPNLVFLINALLMKKGVMLFCSLLSMKSSKDE